MNDTPLISVVIPSFNREMGLRNALSSVLAQTYQEFEIIVVDDGSTDKTQDAVQEIVRSLGGGAERIRYFYQLNQGQSVARNKGIEEARGEWIAFLDSDDLWLPEKLSLQVQAIRQFKGECGACFTDCQMVNDRGMNESSFRCFGRPCEEEVGIASDASIQLAKSFCGYWISALLVRTDLCRKIGGFDPLIQLGEDRDFYFRLALITSLACINKVTVRTDRSASPPGSNCRPWDKWHIRLLSHQRMYEKWLDLSSSSPRELSRTIEMDLRSVHSHWANWYLAHQQYANARQAVSNAMDYGFTLGLGMKWMMTHFMPSLARQLTVVRGSDNAVYSR